MGCKLYYIRRIYIKLCKRSLINFRLNFLYNSTRKKETAFINFNQCRSAKEKKYFKKSVETFTFFFAISGALSASQSYYSRRQSLVILRECAMVTRTRETKVRHREEVVKGPHRCAHNGNTRVSRRAIFIEHSDPTFYPITTLKAQY